jgi:hypothetical protein
MRPIKRRFPVKQADACDHRWKTTARDVEVIIGEDDKLCGEERAKLVPHERRRLSLLLFCSNRTCELVFRREA